MVSSLLRPVTASCDWMLWPVFWTVCYECLVTDSCVWECACGKNTFDRWDDYRFPLLLWQHVVVFSDTTSFCVLWQHVVTDCSDSMLWLIAVTACCDWLLWQQLWLTAVTACCDCCDRVLWLLWQSIMTVVTECCDWLLWQCVVTACCDRLLWQHVVIVVTACCDWLLWQRVVVFSDTARQRTGLPSTWHAGTQLQGQRGQYGEDHDGDMMKTVIWRVHRYIDIFRQRRHTHKVAVRTGGGGGGAEHMNEDGAIYKANSTEIQEGLGENVGNNTEGLHSMVWSWGWGGLMFEISNPINWDCGGCSFFQLKCHSTLTCLVSTDTVSFNKRTRLCGDIWSPWDELVVCF